jgi:hypothetical protein
MILPEQATGKGLEAVYLGPNKVEYRINGQLRAPSEYNRLQDMMTVRGLERDWSKEDRAGNLQSEFEQHKKLAEYDDSLKLKRAQTFADSRWGKAMQESDPEQFQDTMAYLTTGVMPKDRPMAIHSYTVTDSATGKKKRRTVNLREKGPDGLPVMVMPEEEVPPTPWDQKVQAYMKSGQAKTVAEAEELIGKEFMSDEKLANKQKELQVQRIQESIESQNQLQSLRGQAAEAKQKGQLKDFILKFAMPTIRPIARAVSTDQMGNVSESLYRVNIMEMLYKYTGIRWTDANEIMGNDNFSMETSIQIGADEYANRARQRTPQATPGGRGGGPAPAPGTTGGPVGFSRN